MAGKFDKFLNKFRVKDGGTGPAGPGITLIEDNGDGTLTITYGSTGDTVVTGNLQGIPGKEIELQKTATHIQWRYVGDLIRTNLVALVDITGADGEDGNGIASITTNKVGKTTTVTITEDDSTVTNFDIEDGADGTGSGDVMGPATNTADYIPQWNGANSKTLKDGLAVPAGGLAGLTALGGKEDVSNKKTTLSDNSDTYYPSQKAVKTAVDAKQDTMTKASGSDVDTGTDDVKYVTSKAIEDSSYTKSALPLAGGTMTGNITLGENTSIDHDPSLSADGKYTGLAITGTAGAALAFGDLIYLDPTDSRRELADANIAAGSDGDPRGILGICVLAATGDGEPTKILLNGVVRADTVFPTFTINAPIYVSETAGDVVVTQPTTADVVIRVVGFGLTADSMYFNPSNDYITHT